PVRCRVTVGPGALVSADAERQQRVAGREHGQCPDDPAATGLIHDVGSRLGHVGKMLTLLDPQPCAGRTAERPNSSRYRMSASTATKTSRGSRCIQSVNCGYSTRRPIPTITPALYSVKSISGSDGPVSTRYP